MQSDTPFEQRQADSLAPRGNRHERRAYEAQARKRGVQTTAGVYGRLANTSDIIEG